MYSNNYSYKIDRINNNIVKDIHISIGISISIIGIITSELMVFYNHLIYGEMIHILNILAIIFILVFSKLDIKIKNILQSLTLIILLRIINFAMPQFFNSNLKILQYLLIYGIMFVPIYLMMQSQQISIKELGFNINKKLLIYIPMAGVIAIVMSIIEYKILTPKSFFGNINLSNIILLAIIMIIYIGMVEELIFRSLLQTRIQKVLGSKVGILLSGGIFGIMHLSYGLIGEIIFAAMFGIILGYIFEKTHSLIFITSIHGFENILLFGILPIIRNIY